MTAYGVWQGPQPGTVNFIYTVYYLSIQGAELIQ